MVVANMNSEDWKALGRKVANFAPVLGTALGGQQAALSVQSWLRHLALKTIRQQSPKV